MSSLTKKQRDALPESDFAWPSKRLCHILDSDDVSRTASLIEKAPEGERDNIKRAAISIAKKKGLTLPDAWKEDANMSNEDTFAVAFTANFATSREDGDHVITDVPILFKADRYEFKDSEPYEMTPEDIMAAVADFSPVEIDDNHRPRFTADGKPAPRSIFAGGKLGMVTALTPGENYSSFGCTVKAPKWLKALYKDTPLGLSARWDRNAKKLIDVAVTENPRIPEAVLFAAFAADEAAKGGKVNSPHGQKMMQFLHDHTAMGGAKCSEEHSPMIGSAKFSIEAIFTAPHEADAMQKIHDLTLGSGAACALYKENLGKQKDFRPGQHYSITTDMMPAYREYRPGNYAMMNADAKPPEVKPVAEPVKPAEPPQPSQRERELEAALSRANEERRIAEAGRIAAEAVTFAAEMVGSFKVSGTERDRIVKDFQQAALDDAKYPETVEFSDEAGAGKKGTRVDALKASYRARPVDEKLKALTGEKVREPLAIFSIPGVTPTVDDDKTDAVKKAKEYAINLNGLAADA